MDPTLNRDFEQEAMLGDIIRGGKDILSYLTFEEEELGHDDDGSGHRMPKEEGDHNDGFDDRAVPEEEGDHDDRSGDQTEGAVANSSGEVYILIKPVLTN